MFSLVLTPRTLTCYSQRSQFSTPEQNSIFVSFDVEFSSVTYFYLKVILLSLNVYECWAFFMVIVML